jgi:hypothetical protein
MRGLMNTICRATLAIVISAGLWGQAVADPKPPEPTSTPSDVSPEDLIKARAIPYKPVLTRDPFSSPTEMDPKSKGDLVEDVAVKGVVRMGGKPMAVISDSRGNIRWLPVGHQFKDGEISAIDEKSVSFRQWDPNASATNRPSRVVTKTFKREEGKR